jgi:hypothetical protein
VTLIIVVAWPLLVSKSIAFLRNPARSGAIHMFKDLEHLIRLAVVMAFALIAFALLRAAVVPKSFGQYGHYRGAAIAEIAARPTAHAGHEVCESCHTDVVEQKRQGKHVVVPCEACHGPQAQHADDPGNVIPPKLDTAVVCTRCHEANSAKPKDFPQVVTADHSGGLACDTCHQPHRPKIETETKTASAKPAAGDK